MVDDRIVVIPLSEIPRSGSGLPRSIGRPVSWDELTTREPRLRLLFALASGARDRGGAAFCANAVWYGEQSGYVGHAGIRPQLLALVGCKAESPDRVIRSSEAYDRATLTLWRLLPPCRGHCACNGGGHVPSEDARTRVRREWDQMRKWVAPLVFERDGGICMRCGRPEELTVDHIIPISLGGRNALDNFQTLCARCNASKGARS